MGDECNRFEIGLKRLPTYAPQESDKIVVTYQNDWFGYKKAI